LVAVACLLVLLLLHTFTQQTTQQQTDAYAYGAGDYSAYSYGLYGGGYAGTGSGTPSTTYSVGMLKHHPSDLLELTPFFCFSLLSRQTRKHIRWNHWLFVYSADKDKPEET